MKHIINIFFLIIGVGLTLLFGRDSVHFNTLLIGIISAFFITLSIGVLWPRVNYFLNSVNTVESPIVLLTFDDGPDPLTTPRILETLNEHGVKALFFIVGIKAENHPEIIQQIIDNGHLIGNHTYSHPNLFALFSAKRVREEIRRGNEVIQRLTGNDTIWFRPPIGFTNPIIARITRTMALTVIGWNKRSYDTVLKDPAKLEERILSLTTPGSIILLHDNLPQTEKMLPSYIAKAVDNGIIFANEACINSLLR